jgi:hypothetical protein
MTIRLSLLVPALFLAVACAKQEPPPPAEPAPEPPPAATTAAPAPAPTAERDLPTEEDFEEEAAKEVTAANLDSQLDALEKEINAE